tara:strand:- start:6265 stop:7353 length:1089 start_codon:yes stop_codon:yes gene_type:complete
MSEEAEVIDTAPVSDAPVADAAPSLEPTKEAAEPTSIDEELLQVWDKTQNQPRKPDGKYDRKQAAAAAKLITDQPPVKQEAVVQAKASPPSDLPHSWSADKKARLAALPPEYRDVVEYAAQRDKDAFAQISRAGETVKQFQEYVKQYDSLDKVLGHYSADFARRGVHPVQAVATLLDAQAKLDANPRDGLVQIGLSYGIDLRPAFQGQQVQQPANDPRVAQLNDALQQTQARLDAYEQRMVQADQMAEQEQSSALQGHISNFSKDKPYFDEVRPVMAAMLRAGQANDLDDAYDMAVHAKPDVRQRIQLDQRKADEEKRTAEAKSRAEAARKAASVNVKSGPSGSPQRSIDDDLMEIARRHYT